METRIHQHLMAILAADAVGYTRLMHDDERATVEALDSCRLTFRQHIEDQGGRVVDMAGDSVLAVFETATGAVRAGLGAQAAIAAYNASLPESRQMRFRIGVTLGEIIEKPDGTVYGDGVNIASRLQGEAAPETLVIAGAAYDQVHGKIEARFDDLGEHSVKNIDTPVRMYRVFAGDGAAPARPLWNSRRFVYAVPAVIAFLAVIGLGIWQAGWLDSRLRSSAPAVQLEAVFPTGPSIAVLPFVNLSGDEAQDYFTEGLTEDAIAALGRFSNLVVLSRNNTIRFKDSDMTAAQIGQQLGVDYLLEGSVRIADDRIRVGVQLTDAKTGVHLWSDRYDREFEDLFAVQDDITHNVIGALAAKVTRLEERRAASKPPQDLAAYDFVLRAAALRRGGSRSDANEARTFVEQALEIDSDYAAAHAEVAWLRLNEVELGWSANPGRTLEMAEAAARRALALDDNQVGAHVVLGRVHLHKAQYGAAEAELLRAIEINPSDWEGYAGLGVVQLWSSKPHEAIRWFEVALRFQPPNTHPANFAAVGWAYVLVGRYEDALRMTEPVASRPDVHYMVPAARAAAFARLGRGREARAEAARVRRQWPFFKIEVFARQFRDPVHREQVAEGLRLAGLE